MTPVRVTVVVPRALRHLSDGQGRVGVDVGDGATVAGVLTALAERAPGIPDRVLDDRGELRRHVNVFVDDESIRTRDGLATRVHDRAELIILPAVSGGAGGVP